MDINQENHSAMTFLECLKTQNCIINHKQCTSNAPMILKHILSHFWMNLRMNQISNPKIRTGKKKLGGKKKVNDN